MESLKSICLGLLVLASGTLVCWTVGLLVTIPIDLSHVNGGAFGRAYLTTGIGLVTLVACSIIVGLAGAIGESIRRKNR